MVNRQRAQAALVLLCILSILIGASYLRLVRFNANEASLVRDLKSVSRVVYYRVQQQSGPRFQLAGGEKAIRLVTHLALERSAAWPINQYRAAQRYPYGLKISLLSPDGSRRWERVFYLSSAVSKGEPQNGVWTKEATFSETRTFVPTDARVTQIELPKNTPVNSSLEVRLITPDSTFAMARAYGVHGEDETTSWLKNIKMSPEEKRAMVKGVTYLSWDEVEEDQQNQRLASKVLRLTAASNVSSGSKIVSLYVSNYRVVRQPRRLSKENMFVPPWSQTFSIEGPARLVLTLKFGAEQLLDTEESPHLLYIQRTDELGNTLMDVEHFHPREHGTSHRLNHNIDIPKGRQTLRLRWDPPNRRPDVPAVLRSRRNKIFVSHAKDQTQKLVYTLRQTKEGELNLSSDRWNLPGVVADSLIAPKTWRSDYYYLSKETGPLHFLVPGDPEIARIFRINATDWDISPYQSENKMLDFAFLDEGKQSLGQGVSRISQAFDRDRWVTVQGTPRGLDESTPLNVGLGTEQSYSGVAPKGARWIRLSAQKPILVRVSSRAPNTSNYFLKPTAPKTQSEQDPRHWIPMLALEHASHDRRGWVIPVTSTLSDRRASQDEANDEPKAWKKLISIGQPDQHRVLEETVYQETRLGLKNKQQVYPSLAQLWSDCRHCWVELTPHRWYRVNDRFDVSVPPQTMWMTTAASTQCSWEIDGQKDIFSCPVHRERMQVDDLAGGAHRFRWESDSPRDRLWIDRSSVSVYGSGLLDGLAFYSERVLTELAPKGQDYIVSKHGEGKQYLNFRIYRALPKFASSENDIHGPLAVEVELDAGAPSRHAGRLFSHFTPSVKRSRIVASGTPELVFLDDDETGPFQRFEFGFFLGSDIKNGQHRVRIRAQSNQTLWIRAFEQGRALPAETSTVFGQLDPAK